MNFKPIILESPFAEHLTGPAPHYCEKIAKEYLRDAMRDCLLRGEAPFASHGLYTQAGVLKDGVPEERSLGIQAGFAWRGRSDYVVFYCDLGISSGMQLALDECRAEGRTVKMRSLSEWSRTLAFIEGAI